MAVELAPPESDLDEGPAIRRIPLVAALDAGMPWLAGAPAFGVQWPPWRRRSPFLDSPEPSATAVTLGVAHPTGYPLFVLVGHAFPSAWGSPSTATSRATQSASSCTCCSSRRPPRYASRRA